MAPIYSKRLLSARAGSQQTYTVPVGNVAVVRSVTATNTSTAGAQWWTLQEQASGIVLLAGQLQAFESASVLFTDVVDARIVLAGGVTIVSVTQPSVDLTVSGYLFPS